MTDYVCHDFLTPFPRIRVTGTHLHTLQTYTEGNPTFTSESGHMKNKRVNYMFQHNRDQG